jgi:uncharacterized membrane protein
MKKDTPTCGSTATRQRAARDPRISYGVNRMLKKIVKRTIGIIFVLGGIYFVLFEMIALMGEFGVLFSGYNFYLFLFFMTAGICLIYFGVKLLGYRFVKENEG